MDRRWKRHRWWIGVVVVLAVTAGCSDDDDTAPSAASTAPETAESTPETTAAPSMTTTTSTVPPSSTVSVEDVKAQIAADYQRSWQLRRELIANPTLDGLDEKLAQISAPGSEDFVALQGFVNELVTQGERVVPGSPDEFRIDVERVDLEGAPPHTEALATICFVANPVRVDAAGTVTLDNGIVASRSTEGVVSTPNGWLPNGAIADQWQGLGVTQCPSA